MSYILLIFAADNVATVTEAAELAHGRVAPQPPAPGLFGRFRLELESAWPSAASDPALPEGLEPPGDGEAVWALAVDASRAGENLWSHVGHAAARAGLQVLDPQAGVLLRRDGMLLSLVGPARALSAPLPWRTEPHLLPGLTEDEALRWVTEAATHRFGKEGFTAVLHDHWLQFVRRNGDLQQCIEFDVASSAHDKGGCTLHLRMRFHCPKVREVWERRFNDQVAAHIAATLRRPPPEFTVNADQVEDTPSPLSEALGGRKFPHAATRGELTAWFDRITRWFDETGQAVFDRITSVPGLAHYVLHPQQMRWLYLNNNLFIDEILSRLVIVGAFQLERLDEWLAAFRDHRRRKGRDPSFGKDLFIPNRTAVLDELVAYLGTEEFAREALQLKG